MKVGVPAVARPPPACREHQRNRAVLASELRRPPPSEPHSPCTTGRPRRTEWLSSARLPRSIHHRWCRASLTSGPRPQNPPSLPLSNTRVLASATRAPASCRASETFAQNVSWLASQHRLAILLG